MILSSDVEDDPNIWIVSLDLYLKDRVILQGSGWLNDGIIYAAMTLLRDQTKGKLCGWQSTQPGGCKPIASTLPFVQILHVKKCHWITVSNYSVCNRAKFTNTVRVYDSGWPLGVSTEIKEAVCTFYKCKGDTLNFELMDVSWQQNSDDCGVFAIAFATALAHDQDPTAQQWDINHMRRHLQINALKSKSSVVSLPEDGYAQN